MYLVGDVLFDAHYGRYANGCKIVHYTFSDAQVSVNTHGFISPFADELVCVLKLLLPCFV